MAFENSNQAIIDLEYFVNSSLLRFFGRVEYPLPLNKGILLLGSYGVQKTHNSCGRS